MLNQAQSVKTLEQILKDFTVEYIRRFNSQPTKEFLYIVEFIAVELAMVPASSSPKS